jgi:hypothetical protein
LEKGKNNKILNHRISTYETVPTKQPLDLSLLFVKRSLALQNASKLLKVIPETCFHGEN